MYSQDPTLQSIRIEENYKPFRNHILYSLQQLLAIALRTEEYPFHFDKLPVRISYGTEPPPKIDSHPTLHFRASSFFTKEKYLQTESLPSQPLDWVQAGRWLELRKSFFDRDVPVLFWGRHMTDAPVQFENNSLIVEADLVASVFFMLTRYEEILIKNRDTHDRFPARASVSYQSGFLNRPIVNEYAELVWDWISRLAPNAARGKRDYDLMLTHDIDMFRKHISPLQDLREVGHLIKTKKPFMAIQELVDSIGVKAGFKQDSYDAFDALMDTSENFGTRSHFYFMSGDLYKPDTRYDVNNSLVTSTIQHIVNRGHEVGLHPGYDTYTRAAILKREKLRLEDILGHSNFGARQHYLRWKAPITWRIYEEVGLTYDATMGYADSPGFRAGICLPYNTFDAQKGRELSLKAIPLILMDATVRPGKYNPGETVQYMDNLHQLVAECKKHRGIFVLLWHNGTFARLGKDQYLEVLEIVGR